MLTQELFTWVAALVQAPAESQSVKQHDATTLRHVSMTMTYQALHIQRRSFPWMYEMRRSLTASYVIRRSKTSLRQFR